VLFYIVFNWVLFFKLLFKPAQIYYAVDSDTLPSLIMLSWLKRKPLVYDAHEFFSEVPELEGKPIKRKLWHLVTQCGVSRSKLRYTVSHSLATKLSEVYKKPFEVIRNLPESVNLTYQSMYDKPTVIYQGALNKGRCLELLIETI